MALTSSKVNFKASFSTYRSIMKDLAGHKYSKCYLLMGEESYFIDMIVDYIAANIVDEADREFSQTIYYGKEANISTVMASLVSYPMLSEKNVVIVKEAQLLKGIEQLQHYFKQPLDSTIFVLCYKGGTMDKRSALYKKINQEGVVFESVSARDYEIADWINELIVGKGKSIEPVALNMLVDHLGTSLSKIDNEINKLITRIDQSVKSITPAHIEENIGISKEFNNFELTKALSLHDRRKAMMIAMNFAQNPKDNPLVVTLSALFNHFQRLFLLGLMSWNASKKHQPMPSDAEIMQRLKLSSSFFLKEYMGALKYYPSAKTFKILGIIREYDAKSKGIGVGSAMESDLLRELLIKILS
ncbi:MAG: DNA polymerase III subunit delta [Rikenellaceae bacterium]